MPNSEMRSWRDSWPPTQLRLAASSVSKPRLQPVPDDIDEDPFTYFLTPADPETDKTPYSPADDDDEMDFDAGIEDRAHPRSIVRSVSPSSLTGLAKPDRASSPDPDSSSDDDEEYIHLSPSPPHSQSRPLRDLAVDSLRYRPRAPVFGRSANALLMPGSLSYPAPPRGRRRASAGAPRARSLSARARQGRLWREPSPDVWSIEEETEEEMGCLSDPGVLKREGSGEDGEAAKPRKKVRFVLPVGDA